jgi:predicted alpha-1,2-mannosidase
MKKLILIFLFPAVTSAQSPLKYVDPFIGTAPARTVSSLRHSESGSEDKGQTFPAVGRPFGMTQWTPETRTSENKCISPYYYNDSYITGFRGSHWMSGSCTQDYGSMSLMPFTSNLPDTVKNSPVSVFSHKNENSTPAYYSVMLDDYGIQAELTGSVRSGMLRLTYPGNKVNCLFIRSNSDLKQGKIWQDKQKDMIVGYNPVHRLYQGRGQSAGFSGYFVIQFDKPFRLITQTDNQQNIIVSFGGEMNVTVRIGTSFTSLNAAINNLNTEIPDWNFDRTSKNTEEVWNQTLGKVQVEGGSDEQLTKFYTALYHCYQLPRIVSDADGSYQGFAQDTVVHHTAGFDYYDDFSMWDTYRALHPLLVILEPGRTLDMVKSLIIKAEQGGWMPIFPAWGSYTAAMIGDHVSTMISDAYAKGIRGFDIDSAYKYMRKNAFDQPSHVEYVDGKGRRALSSYLKYGYIPLEDSVWDAFHKREQVSRTLEYALDDYALGGFAKSIGKTDDYERLMKRSLNYRNVFDTRTGYVRGRYINKSWVEPFDPYKKVNYICEGTPFQYTWYVPHDVSGLIALMGGRKEFLERLNKFFDGGYYWHGNETDHQASFMFAMAGDPAKTEEWTSRIISDEYGTGPGGLSGNEDAGQMSAWLVFSMMGFYPVCPGTDQYIITAPSFDQVKILLSNGKQFTIKSTNRSRDNYYIQSISRNGENFSGRNLKQKDITDGNSFVFKLTGQAGLKK